MPVRTLTEPTDSASVSENHSISDFPREPVRFQPPRLIRDDPSYTRFSNEIVPSQLSAAQLRYLGSFRVGEQTRQPTHQPIAHPPEDPPGAIPAGDCDAQGEEKVQELQTALDPNSKARR